MQNALGLVRREWARLRGNKLIANASVYVTGSFIQRAFEFLLIPLWTRFLNTEDYGIVGAMNVYLSVLFTVLLLGLAGSVTRQYYDFLDDPAEQKRYVTSVSLFQLGAGLAITLLLDRLGPAIWRAMNLESIPFDPFVRLMIWSAYLRTLIQIPMTLYQVEQKPGRYLSVQYSTFFANFLSAMLLVVVFRMGAAGQMWSTFIAALVVGVVFTLLMYRQWFVAAFDWKHVRSALAYGLPLVPHAVAGWALNAAGRLILQWNVSLSELGLYTLGYNLGLVMNVLVMAINQAWSPFYFRMMEKDSKPNPTMRRVVSIYIALLGILCLAGILYAGDVVHLLLPEKYFGGVPFVGPVLLGYFLFGLYYFAISPVFFYKKTRVVPLLTGSAAVINVVLNLLFIPRFGALGSAWVTTFTYALLLLSALVIGQRYQPVPYPFAAYGLVLLALLAAIFFAALFPPLTLSGLAWKTLALGAFTGLVGWLLLLPALRKPRAA